MATAEIITRYPDILGGTPVFTGARAPVVTLLDYLEMRSTLQDFPTVRREQSIAILETQRTQITGRDEAAAFSFPWC